MIHLSKGIGKKEKIGYEIPISGNDLAEIGQVPGNKRVSVFNRKVGYHFGWDWGSRLVTSGIWKPIILKVGMILRLMTFTFNKNYKKQKQ